MKKYEFLEHVADAKFKAYGKTLEEAFENVAIGMFNIMVKTEKVEPKITKTLEIKGEDLKSLLYVWLEKLLILLDSDRFLLNKAKVEKINKKDGYKFKAQIFGDKISNKYALFGEVKAATYSDMVIKEQKGIWTIQVVVDT